MSSQNWRRYLPRYKLPSIFRWLFGCFGVFLIVVGLFIFFVLPGLLSYIVSGESRLISIVEGTTTLIQGDASLDFVNVEESTDSSDGLYLIFRVEDVEYRIHYESESGSEVIILPGGDLIRVTNVSRSIESGMYMAEFEVFNSSTS